MNEVTEVGRLGNLTERYQIVLQRHARRAEGKMFCFMYYDMARRIGEPCAIKHWTSGDGTFG